MGYKKSVIVLYEERYYGSKRLFLITNHISVNIPPPATAVEPITMPTTAPVLMPSSSWLPPWLLFWSLGALSVPELSVAVELFVVFELSVVGGT